MPSPSYLGHLGLLGYATQIEVIQFVTPKVAKVSKEDKIALQNGAARFEKCKQLCEYEHLLLLRDIWL